MIRLRSPAAFALTRAARQLISGQARGAAAGAQEASEKSVDARKGRVWRWGASQTSLVSKQEVSEASKEPRPLDFAGVSAIACGSNHSAFVVDGQLYTDGSNKFDQLGRPEAGEASTGTGAEPASVVLEAADGHRPAVLRASLGSFHSAAITEGGLLWTWGWGGSFWSGAGALGHASKQLVKEPKLVDRFVETGEELVQVSCGSQHTIVLTNEARIYTTGKGDFGRLGRGDTSDELEFEEVEYFSQSNDSVLAPNEQAVIVKVGAGNNFTAALSQHGEIWVWGRNSHGQLGLGEEAMGDMYSAERYPRLVRSLPVEGHRVVDFACGEHHLVVLTAAGAIYEWGNRLWLEPHPVTLPGRYQEGLKDIVKVAAGDKYSFALTAEGKVYTWGAKNSGCLALGPDCPKNVVEPTLVPPETFGHQKVVDVEASKFRCLAITHEDEYVA